MMQPHPPHAAAAFPAAPSQLRDSSLCPACFAPSAGYAQCYRCGLDLQHPGIAEVAVLSEQAADALDGRLAAISSIRAEQAARAAAPPEGFPGGLAAVPAGGARPGGADEPGGGDAATIGSGAPTGRSGVQLLLIAIAVSLLSLFAIGLLVYAFVQYGVVARSVILGGLTVGAFLGAVLLHRRGLRVSAEGLALLGIVLLGLDLLAIRLNDFFGLLGVRGDLYAGTAMLGVAAGLLIWSRRSALRAPGIAAHLVIVPGVILLGSGVLDAVLDARLTIPLVLLAGVAAGLLHRLTLPDGEQRLLDRLLLLGGALLAAVLLLLPSWLAADTQGPLHPAVPLALLAVLAAAHLWLLVGLRTERLGIAVAASIAAVLIVLAAAAAGSALGGLIGLRWAEHMPLVATTALALIAGEVLARRSAGRTLGTAASAGRWAAAVLLGITGIAMSVPLTLQTLAGYTPQAWRGGIDAEPLWRPLAPLLLGAAILLLGWFALRTVGRRLPVIAGLALVLSLPLPVATGSPLWALIVHAALAAAAVAIAATTEGLRLPLALATALHLGGALLLLRTAEPSWPEAGIVAAAVAGALVLGATLSRLPQRLQAVAVGALITGVLGLLAAVGGRVLDAADAPREATFAIEAWIWPAALLLAGAGLTLLLRRSGRLAGPELAPSIGSALVLLAGGGLAIATALLAEDTWRGLVRGLLLVLVLGAAAVLTAQLRDGRPGLLGWGLFGIAALGGLVLFSNGAIRPIETLSLALGLILTAIAWIRLDDDPEARSWPHLGPAVAVLLIPSLFAITGDPALWRVIGVGVAATAAVLLGAVLRLQAPLVLGAVILLVHLVTQAWPLISMLAAEVPWFIWLGVAGGAVFTLAVRYERGVVALRRAAERIGALR